VNVPFESDSQRFSVRKHRFGHKVEPPSACCRTSATAASQSPDNPSLQFWTDGAAYRPGLATAVWQSTAHVSSNWQLDAEFTPSADRSSMDQHYADWKHAVERSRNRTR
jgi:hypothetical protein